MIYTCSYKNFKTNLYKGCSISGDKWGRAGWKGNSYSLLAPKKKFLTIWHNNKEIISENENNEYYIEEYYKQVLSKLDPEETYRKLDGNFLLCFEDNGEFCHRHIVAAWLELFLDNKVNEVKVDGLAITYLDSPGYIKEVLEKVIKNNTNMRGFNSLRALYLFEMSEKFENEADIMEEKFEKSYGHLRQAAAYLRSEADMIEDDYRVKKLVKRSGNNE
ncbi:MAG: hypothetical protein IJD92_00180 [Bacilli bacterium]|nr:hypothetical protein [Bacilli bacterium]